MDRTSTFRATVAVIVCYCLLSIDDVTTLPLQLCRPLINYVDSLATAGQPVPAHQLLGYLNCLGVQRRTFTDDDSAVRQLLQLQPNSTSVGVDDVPTAAETWTWSDVELCVTVECLERRAGSTFEPCSRLTQSQCTALIHVLERIVSGTTNADEDQSEQNNVDAAARLLEHFRVLITEYRKWRQNHISSPDQLSQTEEESANKKYKRKADSASKLSGTSAMDDKSSGMTSLQVTLGARRMRRAVPSGVPFRLPRKMTPETRAIIQAYLEWRRKNGYGRINGRWG